MKWHKFHPKYQRNSEINWNKWYWTPQIIWKSYRFQLIIFWFVCCSVPSLWRANRVLMHGICRHSWRHPGVRVALIIPYFCQTTPMKWWLVQKKWHSLFVGGFLILCNRFSVKLESPDSGNGHRKRFLLVDHASPLAFPTNTTFLQQKTENPSTTHENHCPPQPWGLHFIKHSAWTPWMVASKRFGCSGRNIYIFQTGSQTISSTENDNKLLSFCPIPSSGELTSNLEKTVSQRWKSWRWWTLPWNSG